MKPKADEAAAARRKILAEHRQITELADVISTTSDRSELERSATRLETLLQLHFREEEDLDGLHASIRTRTPERVSQLQELREEHTALLQMVHRLRELADGPAAAVELHERGMKLVERLRAHEAHENGVFLDSMWNDLGVGD